MRIEIVVTETTFYGKTYELDELLEYLNDGLPPIEQVTFKDLDNSVEALVDAVMSKAHSYDTRSPGFAEDLERHGNIGGQEWVGRIVT